jgi:hypothetical protein
MDVLPVTDFNGSVLGIKTIHMKVGSGAGDQCAVYLFLDLCISVILGALQASA